MILHLRLFGFWSPILGVPGLICLRPDSANCKSPRHRTTATPGSGGTVWPSAGSTATFAGASAAWQTAQCGNDGNLGETLAGWSWFSRSWDFELLGLLVHQTKMAVCQNLVPLVNSKIAGKWTFIPLKMVLIGIDPYPNIFPSKEGLYALK